jgi:uncharacterized protein (TIGR02001 family)
MKPHAVTLLCTLMASSPAAFAGSSLSGNLALTSDYLFRGLSQTWGDPALQGGADWNAGRLHAGAWASNVSHNSYPGGGVVVDVFGDVGLFARGDWSARAGLYSYWYPGANLDRARPPLGSRSLDTVEANVSLAWKGWTVKYSRALTDYFGADVEQGYTGSTRGTQYLQLDGTLPLARRWSLSPHLGYTDYRRGLGTPLVNGARDPSYADYGLTLNYSPKDALRLGLGISHATNDAFYAYVVSFRDPVEVKNLGGTRAFVFLSATF